MSQLASPSPSGLHVETDDLSLPREVEEERDRPVLPEEGCPFSSEEHGRPAPIRAFF